MAALKSLTEPRRLRTRASGTPFWVRSDGQTLIVRPSSGFERVIRQDEFIRCLPFIQEQAPRARWKHLTNNSSYLDSIVDEIGSSDGASSPTISGETFDDALRRGLRDEELDDLRNEIASLRSRLADAQSQAASAEERQRLVHLEQELAATRARARATERRAEEQGTALSAADERVRKLERRLAATRHQPAPSTDDVELRRELKAALEAVDAARERRDIEIRLRQATQARAQQLEEDLERLKKLATTAAEGPTASSGVASTKPENVPAQPAAGPVTFNVVFRVGEIDYKVIARLPKELAGPLELAAPKVFKSPVDAVGDARRALEACVRSLTSRVERESQPLRSMSEMLSSLYGDPSVPSGDWHLMKNLWGRASSVVHEGTTNPRVALWIWLGVLQIAELAIDDAPGTEGAR